MNTYQELIPGTPEYKEFVKKAIAENDKDSLKRIQGNLNEPLHVISNYAGYMKKERPEAVLVHDPITRCYYELPDGKIFDWQGNACKITNIETEPCATIEDIDGFVTGRRILIKGKSVRFILPDNGRD